MSQTVNSQGTDLIINDIVKEYPDMIKVIIYQNSYTIPQGDRNAAKIRKKEHHKEDSIHRSVRRSKMMIKDIMMSNRFDLWCTFTFNCRSCHPKCDNKPCTCDKSTCKRYDLQYTRRILTNWFRNQRKTSPGLKFLAVPEFHKDGAVHYHCLMGSFQGRLKETSKKTKYGQTIYNAPGYYSGFTEFVKIGERFDSVSYDEDYKRVSSYLTKYITKDMPMISGRRRYLVSDGLHRPTSTVNGVDQFHLHKLIRGHKPSYIDDKLEIQMHKKVGVLCPGVQSRLL